jgi:putative ABC transport system permease protein
VPSRRPWLLQSGRRASICSRSFRGRPGGARRSRLRGGRGLLVIEAALGIVLVLSGLLVLKSFANLSGEDLGFRPDGLYAVGVQPAAGRDAPAPPSPEASLAAYQELLELLRGVPGVTSAGGADSVVASGSAPMRGISKDRPIRGGRYQISAGYLETLQTQFIAGRPFTGAELRERAPVGILSASAARHFFPSLPPPDVVGRPLPVDHLALDIVGVVPDLKQRHGEDPSAALFVPAGLEPSRYSLAVIRMHEGQAPSLAELRERLSAHVGPVTVTLRPISEGLDAWLADPRFRAILFSTLALSALLLAAIGLFAVTSLEVAGRRHEMAVRLSLGATGGHILQLVVLGACRPVALGLVVGLVGAYWAERFLQAFLYGIDGRDPVTYVAAVTVLLTATVAAAWIPARRAVRVDPASVLRAQ